MQTVTYHSISTRIREIQQIYTHQIKFSKIVKPKICNFTFYSPYTTQRASDKKICFSIKIADSP